MRSVESRAEGQSREQGISCIAILKRAFFSERGTILSTVPNGISSQNFLEYLSTFAKNTCLFVKFHTKCSFNGTISEFSLDEVFYSIVWGMQPKRCNEEKKGAFMQRDACLCYAERLFSLMDLFTSDCLLLCLH